MVFVSPADDAGKLPAHALTRGPGVTSLWLLVASDGSGSRLLNLTHGHTISGVN